MKIGFIGVGNMGGTLAVSAAKTVNGKDIMLYDTDFEKSDKLAEKIGAVCESLEKTCSADFLFLGVKPNVLPVVLNNIKNMVSENTTVVSMAAGVSIDTIGSVLKTSPIIRIMPNTPAAYGEGMMLVSTNNADEQTVEKLKNIMSASGKVEKIPEKLIDAASAVSGCGPAFAYMFISSLADGGVECGLPYNMALELAAQTVLGAAKTVLESGNHPEALKNAVCSPGGTTVKGVHALENGAFRADTMNAVTSAFERTIELGKK